MSEVPVRLTLYRGLRLVVVSFAMVSCCAVPGDKTVVDISFRGDARCMAAST